MSSIFPAGNFGRGNVNSARNGLPPSGLQPSGLPPTAAQNPGSMQNHSQNGAQMQNNMQQMPSSIGNMQIPGQGFFKKTPAPKFSPGLLLPQNGSTTDLHKIGSNNLQKPGLSNASAGTTNTGVGLNSSTTGLSNTSQGLSNTTNMLKGSPDRTRKSFQSPTLLDGKNLFQTQQKETNNANVLNGTNTMFNTAPQYSTRLPQQNSKNSSTNTSVPNRVPPASSPGNQSLGQKNQPVSPDDPLKGNIDSNIPLDVLRSLRDPDVPRTPNEEDAGTTTNVVTSSDKKSHNVSTDKDLPPPRPARGSLGKSNSNVRASSLWDSKRGPMGSSRDQRPNPMRVSSVDSIQPRTPDLDTNPYASTNVTDPLPNTNTQSNAVNSTLKGPNAELLNRIPQFPLTSARGSGNFRGSQEGAFPQGRRVGFLPERKSGGNLLKKDLTNRIGLHYVGFPGQQQMPPTGQQQMHSQQQMLPPGQQIQGGQPPSLPQNLSNPHTVPNESPSLQNEVSRNASTGSRDLLSSSMSSNMTTHGMAGNRMGSNPNQIPLGSNQMPFSARGNGTLGGGTLLSGNRPGFGLTNNYMGTNSTTNIGNPNKGNPPNLGNPVSKPNVLSQSTSGIGNPASVGVPNNPLGSSKPPATMPMTLGNPVVGNGKHPVGTGMNEVANPALGNGNAQQAFGGVNQVGGMNQVPGFVPNQLGLQPNGLSRGWSVERMMSRPIPEKSPELTDPSNGGKDLQQETIEENRVSEKKATTPTDARKTETQPSMECEAVGAMRPSTTGEQVVEDFEHLLPRKKNSSTRRCTLEVTTTNGISGTEQSCRKKKKKRVRSLGEKEEPRSDGGNDGSGKITRRRKDKKTVENGPPQGAPDGRPSEESVDMEKRSVDKARTSDKSNPEIKRTSDKKSAKRIIQELNSRNSLKDSRPSEKNLIPDARDPVGDAPESILIRSNNPASSAKLQLPSNTSSMSSVLEKTQSEKSQPRENDKSSHPLEKSDYSATKSWHHDKRSSTKRHLSPSNSTSSSSSNKLWGKPVPPRLKDFVMKLDTSVTTKVNTLCAEYPVLLKQLGEVNADQRDEHQNVDEFLRDCFHRSFAFSMKLCDALTTVLVENKKLEEKLRHAGKAESSGALGASSGILGFSTATNSRSVIEPSSSATGGISKHSANDSKPAKSAEDESEYSTTVSNYGSPQDSVSVSSSSIGINKIIPSENSIAERASQRASPSRKLVTPSPNADKGFGDKPSSGSAKPSPFDKPSPSGTPCKKDVPSLSCVVTSKPPSRLPGTVVPRGSRVAQISAKFDRRARVVSDQDQDGKRSPIMASNKHQDPLKPFTKDDEPKFRRQSNEWKRFSSGRRLSGDGLGLNDPLSAKDIGLPTEGFPGAASPFGMVKTVKSYENMTDKDLLDLTQPIPSPKKLSPPPRRKSLKPSQRPQDFDSDEDALDSISDAGSNSITINGRSIGEDDFAELLEVDEKGEISGSLSNSHERRSERHGGSTTKCLSSSKKRIHKRRSGSGISSSSVSPIRRRQDPLSTVPLSDENCSSSETLNTTTSETRDKSKTGGNDQSASSEKSEKRRRSDENSETRRKDETTVDETTAEEDEEPEEASQEHSSSGGHHPIQPGEASIALRDTMFHLLEEQELQGYRVKLTIPENVHPGTLLRFEFGGRVHEVMAPDDVSAGEEILYRVPKRPALEKNSQYALLRNKHLPLPDRRAVCDQVRMPPNYHYVPPGGKSDGETTTTTGAGNGSSSSKGKALTEEDLQQNIKNSDDLLNSSVFVQRQDLYKWLRGRSMDPLLMFMPEETAEELANCV